MRITSNSHLILLRDRLKRQLKITPQALQRRLERKAQELGTETWVALFALAKEAKIPYIRALNSLPEEQQSVIRDTVGRTDSHPQNILPKSKKPLTQRERSELSILVDSLIHDPVLKMRCNDLLRARSSYDRVFREATVVLEHRIRQRAGIRERMKPADLVAKAISPKRDKAILKIGKDNAEQQGFFEIYHGIVLAFRDTVHHELIDSLSRTDALKFCAFIDILLGLLERS